MDEDDARARDIALANLRVEVSTLTEQVSVASLPLALASVRRTVTLAAVLVALALIASSVIHAWSSREVKDLRRRVERLERPDPELPGR
jgi:hypothetical protein